MPMTKCKSGFFLESMKVKSFTLFGMMVTFMELYNFIPVLMTLIDLMSNTVVSQ